MEAKDFKKGEWYHCKCPMTNSEGLVRCESVTITNGYVNFEYYRAKRPNHYHKEFNGDKFRETSCLRCGSHNILNAEHIPKSKVNAILFADQI